MIDWIDDNVARAVSGAVIHSLWQGAVVVAVLWISIRAGLLKTIEQKFHAHVAGALILLGTTIITFTSLLRVTPEILPEAVIPVLHWQSTDSAGLASGGTLGFDWHQTVTIVWLLGVLIFLSRFVTGWFSAHRLINDAHAAGMHWQQRVRQLGRKIGVRQQVRLVASGRTGVPFVFGLFRPVIVFPTLYFTQLTPAQLESILLHELAHIRRHDYLFNCIQLLVESLLFFNPATWWLGRQIRTYREYACDDRVQMMMPHQKIYLEALYKVAEMTLVKPAPAVSLFSNNTELIMRVRRMLNASPQAAQMRPFFTTAMGLLVLGGLLFLNSTSVLNAQQKAVNPPPKPELENLIEKPLLEVSPLVNEVMSAIAPVMEALPEMMDVTPLSEPGLDLVEPVSELVQLSAELALEVAPLSTLAVEIEPMIAAVGELDVAPLVGLAMETAAVSIEPIQLALEHEISAQLDTVPESKRLKELQKLIDEKSAEMEALAHQFETEMETNIEAEVAQMEALAQQLEELQASKMKQLEEQMENAEWQQQMEDLSQELEARMETFEKDLEASIDDELMAQLSQQLEEKALEFERMDTIPPETREKLRADMREIRAQMHEQMAEMRKRHAEMRNDPEIQRLQREMREMHREMAPVHEAHREMMNSPEMKELREKLREQQALMREKMHGFNSELREQMRARATELRELQREMAEEMRRLHREKGNR